MKPEDLLLRHLLATSEEALVDQAHATLRVLLCDTLAVMVAGLTAPVARPLAAAQSRWCAGSSTVATRSLPTAPHELALVLAFAVHDQEFDAVHEEAVVHPFAVLTGALLAELSAARRAICGRHVAAALLLALDVAAGLGRTATQPMRFFRPAMASSLAATLALARLRGFDADTARRALGLALCQLSGTLQAHVEGTAGLALQMGFAAAAAQRAADLAELGCDAPRAALSGAFGYFALYEPEPDLSRLEDLRPGAAVSEISLKPWPTGRAAHAALGALEEILARGEEGAEVSAIRLEAPPLVARLVGRPWRAGMSVSYARLCLQYLADRLLRDRRLDLFSFPPEALAKPPPERPRIEVSAQPDGDPNALSPQRLHIEYGDGRTETRLIDEALGHPTRPLSGRARAAKIRHCLAFAGLPAAAEIQLYRAVECLLGDGDARLALAEIPWPETAP